MISKERKVETGLSVPTYLTMAFVQNGAYIPNNLINPSDLLTQLNIRKSLGITDAKVKLGQLVDEVYYQGDTVLLEKSGKPVAIVVPVEMYRSWQEKRAKSFELIRQVQEKMKGKFTEEEAMNLALEAQQAVRKAQSAQR